MSTTILVPSSTMVAIDLIALNPRDWPRNIKDMAVRLYSIHQKRLKQDLFPKYLLIALIQREIEMGNNLDFLIDI